MLCVTKCLSLCSGLTVEKFMQKLTFQTKISNKKNLNLYKKLSLRMSIYPDSQLNKNKSLFLKTTREFIGLLYRAI